MASGYNAAMNTNAAKYKVYLHQDTFIMNENFIYDILDTFRDKSIGMIGVIGCVDIVPDADYLSVWNIGAVEVYNCYQWFGTVFNQNVNKSPIEVTAIDGLIMVTQYDVPWREDVFDGFDFYDISQSVEMRKAGCKIVVPYQESIWCYHDMRINQLVNYDKYRLKLLETYKDVFDSNNVTLKYSDYEKIKLVIGLREKLLTMMSVGAYDELMVVYNQIREMKIKDEVVKEIVNLIEVYSAEIHNGSKH